MADHECAVDIIAAAGFDNPAGLALEFTCFPMDCAVAVKQARDFVADPAGYSKRWYEQTETATAADSTTEGHPQWKRRGGIDR